MKFLPLARLTNSFVIKELKGETITKIENFNLIPTPLPPMLPEMVNVPETSRYWSFCYYGNKATWSDGRSMATFSFYGVYQPLISHLALNIYLWCYHLGSDDEYPTHAILCDRNDKKMYVGEYIEVEQFLDSQHPHQQPITVEQWSEMKTQVEDVIPHWSESDFKRRGMFEMLGQITKEQQLEQVELIHWLEQQLDEALLRRYINEAYACNYNAIFAEGVT